MGKNIFEISAKYKSILDRIEELEGELTPEFEEALVITEEELEDKIKAYHGVIKTLQGEIEVIKDEKSRLTSLANTKLNLQDRLKSRVLDAVKNFGYDGSSGNKKLDFDTLKLWTVNKDSLEIDENFNNPDYTYLTIKLPGNISTYKEVMGIMSKYLNNDYIKRIEDMNQELTLTLDKKKLADALKKTSVKGANFVNNPYVVMR